MNFAFICTYNDAFTKYARILRKSLEENCKGIPLIFEKVSGDALKTKKRRWEIARDASNYSAVCVLDADMFALEGLLKYFIWASKGLLVGVHNNYMHEFDSKYSVVKKNYYMATNAPLFAPGGHPIFKQILRIMEDNCNSDFEAFNIAAESYLPFLVTLPAEGFTNIHHSSLKPGTRIAHSVDGHLLTENNVLVEMMHGKFLNEKYNELLIEQVKTYFKSETITKNAKKSLDLILKEFGKYQ